MPQSIAAAACARNLFPGAGCVLRRVEGAIRHNALHPRRRTLKFPLPEAEKQPRKAAWRSRLEACPLRETLPTRKTATNK
jgi:hypothetical protein